MKNLIKIKRRLRIEKFLKDELWQYCVVIAYIALCAFIFNKPIEAVLFSIAHCTIRNYCEKQFHCMHTFNCLAMTFTVISFAVLTVLPTTVSLLSSIPLAFFVVYLGYLIQSKIDSAIEMQQLNELVIALTTHKDIYTMNKQELYDYCRSRGLDDVECKIAEFVVIDRLKGKELYEAISYSESQAKRKRKHILNKLK